MEILVKEYLEYVSNEICSEMIENKVQKIANVYETKARHN